MWVYSHFLLSTIHTLRVHAVMFVNAANCIALSASRPRFRATYSLSDNNILTIVPSYWSRKRAWHLASSSSFGIRGRCSKDCKMMIDCEYLPRLLWGFKRLKG